MIRRTYTGEADLKLLQDFNTAAIAATDHCGYLHPGDIPHHLYNGNKYIDPIEIMMIWEDDHGVAAWLMANPSHKSYDAQVRPDLRGNDFERKVLEYADDRTVELMQRYNIASDCIYADAFQDDTARAELLTALGYEPDDELPYILNRTGLFEPVGTHKDYRRRGFGRAIILYGMQQMAAAGMEIATVAHFGNNEAARGLYQACGFQPWHLLVGYKKHLYLQYLLENACT